MIHRKFYITATLMTKKSSVTVAHFRSVKNHGTAPNIWLVQPAELSRKINVRTVYYLLRDSLRTKSAVLQQSIPFEPSVTSTIPPDEATTQIIAPTTLRLLWKIILRLPRTPRLLEQPNLHLLPCGTCLPICVQYSLLMVHYL
jgi:hypothetical protein